MRVNVRIHMCVDMCMHMSLDTHSLLVWLQLGPTRSTATTDTAIFTAGDRRSVPRPYSPVLIPPAIYTQC